MDLSVGPGGHAGLCAAPSPAGAGETISVVDRTYKKRPCCLSSVSPEGVSQSPQEDRHRERMGTLFIVPGNLSHKTVKQSKGRGLPRARPPQGVSTFEPPVQVGPEGPKL